MQKFKQLNDDVNVYAGHEYTEKNLKFAESIESDNQTIKEALEGVKDLRKDGKPTLPSTIGKEKGINLLLKAETLNEFYRTEKCPRQFLIKKVDSCFALWGIV